MPDHEHAELLLLYETAVAEIAAFKQQQWSATYYVLIAQAATVGIGQAIQPLQIADRYVLVVLLMLGLVFGLASLFTLSSSINCRRDRLKKVRGHFGDLFKDARASSKEPDPVPCILAIAQVVGALVVGWLVVSRL